MKTAIVYLSLTGTVKKCAELLQSKIDNTDIIDINTENVDLNNYDNIIIGGALYVSKFNGKLIKFINNNYAALMDKKLGFYVCCVDDKYYEHLKKCVDNTLLNKAAAVEWLGAEIEPSRAKGFNKFILKIMNKVYSKDNMSMPEIKMDKIEALAMVFKG